SPVQVRIAVCPHLFMQMPLFVRTLGFCPTFVQKTLVFVAFYVVVRIESLGYFFYFFYVFYATVIAVLNAVIHLRYFLNGLGIAIIPIADVWQRLGISRNIAYD